MAIHHQIDILFVFVFVSTTVVLTKKANICKFSMYSLCVYCLHMFQHALKEDEDVNSTFQMIQARPP